MAYIQQFKIILWKNWKYFLKTTNIHYFGFILFLSVTFIGALISFEYEEFYYPSVPSEAPYDLSENFGDFAYNHGATILGFVLPNYQSNSSSADKLISLILNDAYVNNTYHHVGFYYKRIESHIFENEKELIDYIDSDKTNSVIAGIIFNDEDYTDYTIRIRCTSVVDTTLPPISDFGQSRRSEYMDTGTIRFTRERYMNTGHTLADDYKSSFVPIQMMVDRAIIQWKTNETIKGYEAEVGKLSKPEVYFGKERNFIDKTSFEGYGSYGMILFIVSFFSVGYRILEEKESNTKECLISLGIHRSILWITWEIIYLVFDLIIILFIMILDPSTTLKGINRFIFIAYYFNYMLSSHAIIIIMTFFINKTKSLIMMTCFVLFSFLKINEFIYPLDDNTTLKKILSLTFSPINFSMGGCEITKTYCHHEYIGFDNLFKTDFGQYFIYGIIDVIVYYLIILVLDYLSGFDFRALTIKNLKNDQRENNPYTNDIQKDPEGLECLVQVKNITKCFKLRGNSSSRQSHNPSINQRIFLANDNISFNVYKNEIFAILGHNGAGKSTLIKNMIGNLNPDAGDTYYNGLPISKYRKEIHKDIGICHQYNILFKKFTVLEHIQIYCGIKKIKVDIESYLREIDLWNKKDCEIQHLSGGQKRKLCIGLAFIGHPRYVFLDEPTTGLDPLSRQKIWSFLLKKRQDRVIFITTHYMDEADIIADRKLILKEGTIRCMGSSIYLKNHFHMKYRLEVETHHPMEIHKIIKRCIPEAEYVNNKPSTFTDKTSDASLSIDIDNDDDDDINNNTNDDINHHHHHHHHHQSNNNNIDISTLPASSKKSSTIELMNQNHCYVWKISNESSSKLSSLLKILEAKRGTLLHDFSLNAPLLQELFIQLERENNNKIIKDHSNQHDHEKEDEKEDEDEDEKNTLPKYKSVKKPGHLSAALRVSYYRFKINSRQKVYILITLIFPFIIMFFFFKILKFTADNVSLNNYPSLELSSENLYKGERWNYDLHHSNTLDQVLPLSILEQEFPKTPMDMESEINRNMTSSPGGLTLFTTEEMETIGQEIYQHPYYVGNVQGNYSAIDHQYYFKVYCNDSMPHALPSTLNALTNAILASQNINDTVHVRSHPLNVFDIKSQTSLKYYSVLILSICITFVLAFYGSSSVYERSSHLLKRLQLIGISNRSYWLSFLITDYLWFFASWALMLVAIILANFTPLLYFNFILILVTYWALISIPCLLFQYCVSFIFSNENLAYLILLIINILPTFYITSDIMMKGYETDSENFRTDLRVFLFICNACADALLPNYGFTRVFKNLISLGIKHQANHYDLSFRHLLLLPKNEISQHYLGALLSIFLYGYLLTYITRLKYHRTRRGVIPIEGAIQATFQEENEKKNDIDLREEYQRVKEDIDSGKHSIPMKFIHLTHEYNGFDFSTKQEMIDAMNRKKASHYGELHLSEFGSHRVVMTAFKNISFGIRRCECFGVLGPNGSGKSSLLNTSTFLLKQTLGDIYYDGKNTLDVKGNEIPLGYCAQEDVVWENLTLMEHIEMHFFVYGYSHKASKKLAKQLLHYCHLQSHKNKYPHELSGGNLRKLNILMAICCSFTKVMLDEPTAGMDPSTRYYIWDIIRESIQRNQTSIVMTTHSMEEAELLCHRLAIMVNGKLQCIGSPEHLKMKYGHTYLLDVQTDDVEAFHRRMILEQHLFGAAEYKRDVKSPHHVTYEVMSTENVSHVFEMMESCREEKLFVDYSYSQTSLEQVFLNFAALKEHTDDQ